jgi:hypothetical protein
LLIGGETSAGNLLPSGTQDEIASQRTSADPEHPDETTRVIKRAAKLDTKRGDKDMPGLHLSIGQDERIGKVKIRPAGLRCPTGDNREAITDFEAFDRINCDRPMRIA